MFYENYLNSLKADMSFIPESASFKDAGIFTERSIQDAFNEAFIGLAMDEMTMFESAFNEAEGDGKVETKTSPEKKKEILNSIKKFFTTIWEKVKGFFITIIDKVKEIYTKFKVEKGKVIEKDFNESLDKLAKNRGRDDSIGVRLYEKKAIDALNNQKVDFEKIASYANGALQDFITDNANFAESYSKEAIFDELKNINTLAKFEPKENASLNDVIANRKNITDLVFKSDSIIKTIKDNYGKAKKIIDGCMEDAKKIVNKDMNVKSYLKVAAVFTSILTKTQSAYLTEAKKIRSNYVGVVSKIIVMTKRTVKEDTEITIDVQETPDEDTKVDVKTEPESSDVEVKDEVEEAFNALLEEDDVEAAKKSAEGDKVDAEAAPEAVKEEDEVDIEVDEEPSDDDMVEESTDLYRALVSYLAI